MADWGSGRSPVKIRWSANQISNTKTGAAATPAIVPLRGMTAQSWAALLVSTITPPRAPSPASASLARQVLGFESRLDAPAAVDWTMDWYRAQADGGDALALMRDQISRYESL